MGLFGIGDGKIELNLKGSDISVGMTLEGTAVLTLNKDKKAKGVIAVLFAEKTETQMINGNMQKRNITVYKNEQSLDTEKTYLKSSSPLTYNFKFVIPQTGANPQGVMGSTLGKLITGGISGVGGGVVRWYIEVKLHEGLLSNVSAKKEINMVGQQAPSGSGTIQG